MLVYFWLYIFELFASAASHSKIKLSKPHKKDRKVNLALETVLEFNDNDNTANLRFLNNVQEFIGKVKTVIGNNNFRRRDFNGGNVETFTGFVHNAIEILSKYNDADLEYFFAILSDEVRKYHYRGCKFYELTDNFGLRKFIANALDTYKNIPAQTIRANIAVISDKIEQEKYNNNERELVDFINSLYRNGSSEKFRRILVNIDDYRLRARRNMDLVKIIRAGIRSIIFDHYTGLNHNARVALKLKIDEYWKYAMDLSKTLVSQLNAEEAKLRSYNTDTRIKIVDDEKNKMRQHANEIKALKDTTTTSKTVDIHIDLKRFKYVRYDIPTLEHPEEKIKKKLTFRTLYPRFVTDPTPQFRVGSTSLITKGIQYDLVEEREDIKPVLNAADKEYIPTTNNTETKDYYNVKIENIKVKESNTKIVQKRNKKLSTDDGDRDRRTTRQVYMENDPHPYDKYYGALRTRPKLTFMTLYPELFTEHSSKRTKIVKPSSTTHENAMQTLWYEDMNEIREDTKVAGRQRVNGLEHKDGVEMVTIRAYVPRGITRFKFATSSGDTHKQTTHEVINKFGIQLKYPRSRFLNPNSKARKEFNGPSTVTLTKQFIIYPIDTTIPTFIRKNAKELPGELIKGGHRRYNDMSGKDMAKESILVQKHILTRIQDLEKELRVVKKQVKNDTKIIKDLNSKVHGKERNHDVRKSAKSYHDVDTNEAHRTKPVKEVVIDLAAQIDLDDARLQKDYDTGKPRKYTTNYVKLKSYVKDSYEHVSKKNSKVKERKYDADRNAFIRGKNQNIEENQFIRDSVKLSHESTDYERPHFHSSQERQPYHSKQYTNNKIRGKEQGFGRITINRLDDVDDTEESKKDDGRNNDKSHKQIQPVFEVERLSEDRPMTYSNKDDERKYGSDKNTIKKDQNKVNILDKNKNVNKYKSKDDANIYKYRKEQEKKYYSVDKRYPMYDTDDDKIMKPKERIYDSDSNRNDYKKAVYIDKETQKRVDEKFSRFQADNDVDRKIFSNNKNYAPSLNKTKAKGFGVEVEKLIETKERNYNTDLSKDNYKKDKIKGNQEVKETKNEVHIEKHETHQNNATINTVEDTTKHSDTKKDPVTHKRHIEFKEGKNNYFDATDNEKSHDPIPTDKNEPTKVDGHIDLETTSRKERHSNSETVSDINRDSYVIYRGRNSNTSSVNANSGTHSERNRFKIVDDYTDGSTKNVVRLSELGSIIEKEFEKNRSMNNLNTKMEHKFNAVQEKIKARQDVEANHDVILKDKGRIYETNNDNHIEQDLYTEKGTKNIDKGEIIVAEDNDKIATVSKSDTGKNISNIDRAQYKDDVHKMETKKGFDNYLHEEEHPITDEKLNKSIEISPEKLDDKHENSIYGDKYNLEEVNNKTDVLNSNKVTQITNNKDTTLEKTTAVKKDPIDIKISKENEKFEIENIKTSEASSKIILTTGKSTTISSTQASVRRIFNDKNTPVSKDEIKTPTNEPREAEEEIKYPDYNPDEVRKEAIKELDPIEALDLGLINYDDTRRAMQIQKENDRRLNDTDVTKEDYEMIMNKTLELYDMRNKNTEQLDREVYDFINFDGLVSNVSEKSVVVPSPDFIAPPDFDRMKI